MKKMLLLSGIALTCSLSAMAQIPELTDQPSNILGSPSLCKEKVDLVLDATNNSKYYRFGIIHNVDVSNWAQLYHQFIALGPADMDNQNTPINRNLYGVYAEMNTDKAFFGLRYRSQSDKERIGEIDGKCYDYDYNNQSDALIAWGNDVQDYNNNPDRLIFEFHHFSYPPLEVATMLPGGEVGIATPNPTAYLHVDCQGHNPDDGSAGSDVRFERLERGRGNILVIDRNGYVYDSGVPLTGATGAGDAATLYAQEKERNDRMEQRIKELEARLEALSTKAGVQPGTSGSVLYQNVPNPFGRETVIEFFIQDLRQHAEIVITDINGREVNRYAIAQKGLGRILVNDDRLSTGTYVYTLVVDGNKVDSKRMIVSK